MNGYPRTMASWITWFQGSGSGNKQDDLAKAVVRFESAVRCLHLRHGKLAIQRRTQLARGKQRDDFLLKSPRDRDLFFQRARAQNGAAQLQALVEHAGKVEFSA